MKILLVEDDFNKARRVIEAIEAEFPSIIIDHARSFKSALQRLVREIYTLVILDMTLTMFDPDEYDPSGFRVEHFGGCHLLKEMDLRNIQQPTVVLTQFDVLGPIESRITLEELNADLLANYSEFYRGAIFYKASEHQWKTQLFSHIDQRKELI